MQKITDLLLIALRATFTQHWRNVIFTLLLGFIASATSTLCYASNPPVADPSHSSNLVGSIPLTANFDGSASTDDQGIVSYLWDFGDGTTGTGMKTTHTYTTARRYDAFLTVTDADGQTSTLILDVEASTPSGAPGVAVTATPASGAGPLPVDLSGFFSICTGGCRSFHWNYGDGTTNNQADQDSTNHTYKNVGTYTATLTVTDNIGRTATASVLITVQQGETLTSYVNTCKQQLVFNDADIPTNLNCATTGVLFAPPGAPVNDFFGYARVTDDVDLAFACRWVNNGDGTNDQFTVPPFVQAVSIELLINNHQSGRTCFFKARDTVVLPNGLTQSMNPSTTIVSPTVAAAAAPNTPQANYWDLPIELDRTTPCTDCHVAGPYISSPRIAPFLARFGLLNNGHDTFGLTKDAQNNLVGNFRAVGSTFAHFNDLAFNNNEPSTCASGCHSIGYKSTTGDISIIVTLIPSIASVIDINGTGPDNISIAAAGVMPADGPSTGTADSNAYSWINRDNPGSDGVDIETFTASKLRFQVLDYCGVPTLLDAHVVGSSANFSTADMAKLPDKLSVFNAREGLVCLNSDQPGGRQCNNYSIKYLCSDGNWSGVYDMDQPTFGGDHEERFNDANVCTSKPGLTALAIQATTTVNGNTLVVNGPADRLAQFIPSGLICRNSDQPNGGQCSNYVVHYRSCQSSSQANLARIKNSWTNPPTFTDRYLTTTNNVNGAETRAQGNNYQYPSQDWIIEVVSGSTVRLKDIWSGKYLTASSTNDLATVVVNDSNTTLTRQQWVEESIPNSSEVRFRNVGSGRYLTVGNYTTDPYYAPIISQSLSNQNWTSQRWLIQ